MTDDFKSINEMINYSSGGIISKVIFKGKDNQITLFCMAKDTDIGEYTSTKEGFVYVIDGEGIFNLDGKDISIGPGILIQMDRNAKHSIIAQENTSFLLFLTK